MSKQEQLRQLLLDYQGQQSNNEFARLLSVPVSTWRHTRTGHRRIGRRIAIAAMLAYPRWRQLIAEALLEVA